MRAYAQIVNLSTGVPSMHYGASSTLCRRKNGSFATRTKLMEPEKLKEGGEYFLMHK